MVFILTSFVKLTFLVCLPSTTRRRAEAHGNYSAMELCALNEKKKKRISEWHLKGRFSKEYCVNIRTETKKKKKISVSHLSRTLGRRRYYSIFWI